MRSRPSAVCAAVLLCAAGSAGYRMAASVPRSRLVRPALHCSLVEGETAEIEAVEAPPRPRMAPGPTTLAPHEAEAEELAGAHAMVEEVELPVAPKVEVFMDKLKDTEDKDGGISAVLGGVLNVIDGSGTLRKRLWTRADFMHIHAVTGAYFLALGMPWLLYSHLTNALDTSAMMATSSLFLTSLLLAGLVNAASAIPMSRFSSNKMFDIKDLKANGFTFGGTGLTTMCLWIAWWFSGTYPNWLHWLDIPIFMVWTAVCVGTTVNWEYMLQQNFEANERAGRKFAKVSKEEMNKKAILYRLASWPNLTQLMFMWSIPAGGMAWLNAVTEIWPKQSIPMYHYGIASAMGYALSMFSETLRDRKIVTLEQDLLILIFGFCFPMVSIVIDGLTYGDQVTIWPPDYWVLFGGPHLG